MCGRPIESHDRVACAGCARKFLSEQDRERHYARNPTHAPAGFDAEGNPPTDGWVEIEKDGGTVIVLPREDVVGGLEVAYDPGSRTVRISDGRDERFDVSHVPDVAESEFEWRFDGRHLELAFRR